MKVLILGKYSLSISSCIEKLEAEVHYGHNNPLSLINLKSQKYDFIVSYGYRHIIPENITRYMHKRIINLHISFLPWNRGADPNLWSWLDDTPKGVTIHFIDEGVDTGDIIVQERISFPEEVREWNLETTYRCLSVHIEKLFACWWKFIATNKVEPMQQIGGGSAHKIQDKEQYSHLLTQGWSTPVKQLVGKGIR